ncbi:MAG: hypothetical protein H7335_00970 [Massilia sp.]|nr:hypothetical protein [Massilia sp.]
MLAAALACCCIGAQAHQFHLAITELSFNPNTGSTEIVHTYMAHDIEALLANLYQRQFDLSVPQDEAILRVYIDKQFWVLAEDQRRLPLRWLGLSVNRESVVIYQEIERSPLSDVAQIHNAVLIDFIAEQTNTLNVNEKSIIKTLIFDRKKLDQRLR